MRYNYEAELKKAIKVKEKEKEVMYGELSRLNMHLSTYREGLKELSDAGFNKTADFLFKGELEAVMSKLVNVTIDTLNTITEDDIKVISNAYQAVLKYQQQIEKEIEVELGLRKNEAKEVELGLSKNEAEEVAEQSGGLFDDLLQKEW